MKHNREIKKRIAASFSQAAKQYESAAEIQWLVGQEIMSRFDYINIEPTSVLDVGCSTGRFTQLLKSRYKKAQVFGVDLAFGMVKEAKKRVPKLFDKYYLTCGDAEQLPFKRDSFDLIFSNFTIQWCQAPEKVFNEFFRVLKPGGLLMFSTLGPDTLHELRTSWATIDNRPRVNQFFDMHDTGDALVKSGFLDPVMDVRHYYQHYYQVVDLLKELKTIGSIQNSAEGIKTITTKKQLRQMSSAYDVFKTADNQYPATYEIVFGHAWTPKFKTYKEDDKQTTHIPFDTLRQTLKK